MEKVNYDLSHTKLTPDRLYTLDCLSDLCLGLDGDFAECGVWQGGSAKVLLKKKIHLFDTFSGMPTHTERVDPPGSFKDTSIGLVRSYLKSPLVTYHAGWIPDSFKGLEDKKYSFVHIDVDLYQSTKDCLDYFLPRLAKGGMIVFDDYGFPDYENAEKKAVDERIKVIELKSGQALYIERRR